jgi:hypothetical protein
MRRLCQEILFVKAPLAELVFPHIFGSLAGGDDPGFELCTLIAKQVCEETLLRHVGAPVTPSSMAQFNTFGRLSLLGSKYHGQFDVLD